jgi:integrase
LSNKTTVAEWIEYWISIGCPGKKKKAIGAKSQERYAEMTRSYVLPALGHKRLQKLVATEIDTLYTKLFEKLADRSVHSIHVILSSALSRAVTAKAISRSPMLDLLKTPAYGEADHGMVLNASELVRLVKGFRATGSTIAPIVAVAAFTGARRSEILALRWSDFDQDKSTLSITRAVEQLKTGLTFKGTKKKSHERVITIDPDLVAMLVSERDKHRRIIAGVPEGAAVDLRAIKLPEGALMFPDLASGDFTTPRSPRSVSTLFKRLARRIDRAKFAGLRFHDLRGSYETMLLDAGEPVHAVAKRCGHDAATLLKSYAKMTGDADAKAASTGGALLAGAPSWNACRTEMLSNR